MIGRRSTSTVLHNLNTALTLRGKQLTSQVTTIPRTHHAGDALIVTVGNRSNHNPNDPINIRIEQAALLADAKFISDKIPGSKKLGYFSLLKDVHDRFWKLDARLNEATNKAKSQDSEPQLWESSDEVISQDKRRGRR